MDKLDPATIQRMMGSNAPPLDQLRKMLQNPEAVKRVRKMLNQSLNGPNKPQPKTKQNKIGRNDPCPCKSGKKYKKCCYEVKK